MTDVLARTLYGEARGEYSLVGPVAFMAVAWVVRNRMGLPQQFGATLEDVCRKPYQFSCWNRHDPNRTLIEGNLEHDALFALCCKVGDWVMQADAWSDVTKGSQHYHTCGVAPYWSRGKVPQIVFGHHVFYKI